MYIRNTFIGGSGAALAPAPPAKHPRRGEARSPFSTLRLTGSGEFGQLEGAWNDLQGRTAHTLFQTYAWNAAWWRCFGADFELCIVLVYADARLLALAPLMTRRARSGRGCVQFIGSSNFAADFCDFLVDPGAPHALDVLLDCLWAETAGLARIDLSHIRDTSPNLARMRWFFNDRRIRFDQNLVLRAPLRVLGDDVQDARAANKKSLRKNRNYFQKAGALRYQRFGQAREAEAQLEGFFLQHRRRWAGTRTPSRFAEPAYRRFYRELLRAGLPQGWLRFEAVSLDGQPIAYHFGFEYQGCLLIYKTTFDVAHADHSPGEVLLKFMLEDAMQRRLREFDFTVGEEPYKFRFSNALRSVHRLIAFKSRRDYWTHRGVRLAKAAARSLVGRRGAGLPARIALRP